MRRVLPDCKKTAAAFSMAASAIGAISSMQQAASKTKVNAVDREIASEKKRDGQSAKSVAKLQQLEKKKEQMEKKAFETKKKMMLAQAIMSTAAGVAMALTGRASADDCPTLFQFPNVVTAVTRLGKPRVPLTWTTRSISCSASDQ